MKRTAMLFQDKYKVVFETSEIGTLSDTEVLVENIYSLISPGTELALFMGTHVGFKDPEITWARYPIAPGYASVGRIVGIGKSVSQFRMGEYLFHYGTHASHSVINVEQALHFEWIPMPIRSRSFWEDLPRSHTLQRPASEGKREMCWSMAAAWLEIFVPRFSRQLRKTECCGGSFGRSAESGREVRAGDDPSEAR